MVEERVVVDTEEKDSVVKSKLWTKNFILLLQGQLVSNFGTAIYSIVLGFWVLEKTGSTAIMGTMLALSVIPRIIISPIAGTLIDRNSKKWVVVLTDFMNGILMLTLGLLDYAGLATVWMVMVVGVLNGIFGCFFGPAINAMKPFIISKDKLVKGNSILSMSDRGISIVGTSLAGFLFVVLGPSLLFIVNGISYLFSAFTELFIVIDEKKKKRSQVKFVEDLKVGINYVVKNIGLRQLFIIIGCLNFFASMTMVLLLPYFNATSFLGVEKYGVGMAFSTSGLLVGYLLLTIIDINKYNKLLFFTINGMLSSIMMMTLANLPSFTLIAVVLFVHGVTVSFSRAVIEVTLQSTTDKAYLGRVYGLRRTVSQSLVPIAMALGGILGEFVDLKIIITSCSLVLLVMFILTLRSKALREMIQ